MHGKVPALTTLLRSVGGVVDRLEHSGRDGSPIETSLKVQLSKLSLDELAVFKRVIELTAVEGDVDGDNGGREGAGRSLMLARDP
jgi:hypothetical protein